MKYMIFIVIFIPFQMMANCNFELFLDALATVESSRNSQAYNPKEKAIGIYQIRPAYFKDAIEFSPALRKYKHEDCYNPEIALEIVKSYFNRYGKKDLQSLNFEGLARLHNGGPKWKTKTGKAKINLDIYAGKVKKELTKKL